MKEKGPKRTLLPLRALRGNLTLRPVTNQIAGRKAAISTASFLKKENQKELYYRSGRCGKS
ncbi:hypothetical protein AAAT94_04390 [Intestinimonas aquisgranensis]|nr:hypothetical protein [Intestinimonas aquisgranensis]